MDAALKGFQEVLDMEAGARGDWGFKALKQVCRGGCVDSGEPRARGEERSARRHGESARRAPSLNLSLSLFPLRLHRSSSSATAWARLTR